MTTNAPAALTLSEAINSMTGVEYSNANTLSKGRLLKLVEEDPIEAMFVVVTILKLRENKQTVYGTVKAEMTIKNVQDFFSPEPDDDDTSELGNA